MTDRGKSWWERLFFVFGDKAMRNEDGLQQGVYSFARTLSGNGAVTLGLMRVEEGW